MSPERVTALAIVGRQSVDFEVLMQWIITLRKVHWPGPCFLMPEIYAAGQWIGVVPLRNLCTYYALTSLEPWDELLWIDADHRVSTGIVERIKEHAGRYPVLGGVYFSREWPYEIQAFDRMVPEGFHHVEPKILVPLLTAGTPAVLPVLGVGTGCMLIQRWVLERMAELRGSPGQVWRTDQMPWEMQQRLIDLGERPSGVWSEDIMFCRDVRELLGIQTHLDLDPRMETGHVARETRDRRHYLAAHTVPPGVEVDEAALARRGYRIEPMSNRAARRALHRAARAGR